MTKTQEFLNAMIAAGNSAVTFNKALSASNKFFKWAVRTKRATYNPFDGIKKRREEKTSAIIYSTREERESIIATAKATGWPDWIAIPIAYYAGLRRGEIADLRWTDIRFGEGLIAIRKSKTGRSRETPLHSVLEGILSAIPENQRRGYVVPMPPDQNRLDRLTNLVKRVRDDREAQLMAELAIPKPVYRMKTMDGKYKQDRRDQYREDLAQYNVAKKKRKREIAKHLETITWNSFRHTFASLLVQSGVDIDTVTS